MKNLILITTLALNMMAIQTTAATLSIKPQVFGPLKISYDHNNKLIILPTKAVITDKLNLQLRKTIENYDKLYAKRLTAEEKASFAYQFLLQLANKSDFKVRLIEDYHGDKMLIMNIFEDNRHTMLGHLVIPTQDIDTVYPLLISLIKNKQ